MSTGAADHHCPICGNAANRVARIGGKDAYEIECLTCGTYHATGRAKSMLGAREPEERLRLTWATGLAGCGGKARCAERWRCCHPAGTAAPAAADGQDLDEIHDLDGQRALDHATGGNYGTRFTAGNPYRFKPGQSGNPAGLSHARRVVEAIARAADKAADSDSEATQLDAVVEQLFLTARRGGSAGTLAAREIFDRIGGRVPLPFRLTNEGPAGEMDLDIRIEVVESPSMERYRAGKLIGAEANPRD